MSRVRRNRFVERWAGREWELRQNPSAVTETVAQARKNGDPEEAPLFIGQDAGLIHDLLPAANIVQQIVSDASEIISERLPSVVKY